jgi:hypothetical protein
MGFLVLVLEPVIPGQIAKYRLVNGQQRLTTLSLVLCALCEAAEAAGPPVRRALRLRCVTPARRKAHPPILTTQGRSPLPDQVDLGARRSASQERTPQPA